MENLRIFLPKAADLANVRVTRNQEGYGMIIFSLCIRRGMKREKMEEEVSEREWGERYLERDDTSTQNIVQRQMSCMAEGNIAVNTAESAKQERHQGTLW